MLKLRPVVYLGASLPKYTFVPTTVLKLPIVHVTASAICLLPLLSALLLTQARLPG